MTSDDLPDAWQGGAELRTRSCLSRSRRSRHWSWYRYWRRPAASVPTAWMCPRGSAQIQTSSQAGG